MLLATVLIAYDTAYAICMDLKIAVCTQKHALGMVVVGAPLVRPVQGCRHYYRAAAARIVYQCCVVHPQNR